MLFDEVVLRYLVVCHCSLRIDSIKNKYETIHVTHTHTHMQRERERKREFPTARHQHTP